jgi:hypothetical protein
MTWQHGIGVGIGILFALFTGIMVFQSWVAPAVLAFHIGSKAAYSTSGVKERRSQFRVA